MDTQPSKICVCGAGTMGSGIALACAQHGFDVVLFDVNEHAIASAKKTADAWLQRRPDQKDAVPGGTLNKVHFTSSIDDCIADVIIEAVVENAEIKASLFNRLAAINGNAAIFATNTSSLSVTEIAERFSRPAQLAGMHFFNPATVMQLVEVVRTKYTSPTTLDTIIKFVERLGKTTVVCNDAPGFIVNHVARPYYLEALYLVEKYNTPIETVDALMEATGFKMGPFKLMDLIGNDINYSVSCTVYDALQRPERLCPSPIQREKVKNGLLGRKTGRGYYAYNK